MGREAAASPLSTGGPATAAHPLLRECLHRPNRRLGQLDVLGEHEIVGGPAERDPVGAAVDASHAWGSRCGAGDGAGPKGGGGVAPRSWRGGHLSAYPPALRALSDRLLAS
jgi:hypothetical protein